MVESSALLKRHTPKGYRGFESLPHRQVADSGQLLAFATSRARSRVGDENLFDRWGPERVD